MPMFFDEEVEQRITSDMGYQLPQTKPEEKDYSMSDIISAAFQTDNTVGSFLYKEGYQDVLERTKYDPTYSVWEEIKGTKYEQYADSFIDADNTSIAQVIKSNIDRELENREVLSNSGVAGFGASIAASILDPINLVGGGAIGLVKTGGTVVRIGKTAVLAGATQVPVELALHATQETRTAEESAFNVTGGALMVGIMGTALQGLGRNTVHELGDEVIDSITIPTKPIPDAIPVGEIAPRNVGAAQNIMTNIQDETTLKNIGATVTEKGLSWLTPLTRTMQSPSVNVRRVAQGLAENGFITQKNIDGVANEIAVESLIKNKVAVRAYEVINAQKDNYKAYKQRVVSEGGKALSKSEFNELVGKAMRRDDISDIPEVKQVAQHYRKVSDGLKDDMIKAGLLDEDSLIKGESYFHRVYNQEAIDKNYDRWINVVSKYVKGGADKTVKGAAIKLNKLRPQWSVINGLEAQLRTIRDAIENGDDIFKGKVLSTSDDGVEELVSDVEYFKASVDKLREIYPEMDIPYPKTKIDDVGIEYVTKEDFIKFISDVGEIIEGKASQRGRLVGGLSDKIKTQMDEFETIIERSGMEDWEAKEIAQRITNNIRGNGGSMDVNGLPDDLVSRVGLSKSRTFNIDSIDIEDFLINDAEYVMLKTIKEATPQAEIASKFGDVHLRNMAIEIDDEYTEILSKAKNNKERAKIEKQWENDKRDIQAMRDRLLGTYGRPNDPSSIAITASRTVRELNFMTMLGGMTISAIPDMGRQIITNGFRNVKAMKLAFDFKNIGKAKTEMQKLGLTVETLMSSRALAMADIAEQVHPKTAVGRTWQKTQQHFSTMTLMNHWNDMQKGITGLMSQDYILEKSIAATKGKLAKKDVQRLAKLGLNEGDLKAIAKEFEKHGDTIKQGSGKLLLSRAYDWDDVNLAEKFKAVLTKEVDTTVITPGVGDKPLWFSSEVGKTLFQFKSFVVASLNRGLIPSLQQNDAKMYAGVVSQVALGMFAYQLTQFVKGEELSSDPQQLIKEGVDRSGVVAVLTTGLGTVETVLGTNIVGPQLSRYEQRSKLEGLLGPSWGTFEKMQRVSSATLAGDWDEGTVGAARRLIPAQNLFYLRQLFNKVEESAGEAVD